MESKSEHIAGALSDIDIERLINEESILIHPYNPKNLTPLGYNLSFTKFIYSVNNKILYKILTENDKLFCDIEPNDTVLILSHEAVWIDKSLLGTFHSKVGIVSKGFGHISTTLDPDWEGPLLFSLNNPTSKTLRIEIGEEGPGKIAYNTFVTLIFHKLITCSKTEHDNQPARIDILKNIKDSLRESKDKQDLLRILGNFQALVIEREGISNSSNSEAKRDKINKFKSRYSNFDTKIGECINQVDVIRNEQNKRRACKRGVILISIVIIFLAVAIFAICSFINQNYSILSLISIINAILIFVAREIYYKHVRG